MNIFLRIVKSLKARSKSFINSFKPSMNIPLRKYKSLLPDNPVIIDCGAHIGADTVKLAKIKGSKIYAFEAAKDIFSQLKENTRLFPNITCFNVALGTADGTADFHISSGGSDGSSSLLVPKDHLTTYPDVHFNTTEKVRVQKLDTWAVENGIEKVDMLWLDMQGAEEMTLRASSTILKTVKLIHTEVSTIETYEGVQTYQGFKDYLIGEGFKVVVEAIPEHYDMGNVLFCRI